VLLYLWMEEVYFALCEALDYEMGLMLCETLSCIVGVLNW
jgi:hypothetical protein